MRRIILVFVTVLFFLPGLIDAAPKISGKYELIGNIEDLRGVKKINMVEFFNFSCGHCYRFLVTANRLENKYKDKLTHTSFPIFWGKQTPYPTMAYLIAKDNGKEKLAKKEIFDAMFKMDINVFEYRMISFIASSLGIGEEFEKASKHSDMHKRVDDMLKQASRYGVDQTPTVIINNVIKVNPGMTDGDVEKMTDNIDRIIEDILGN